MLGLSVNLIPQHQEQEYVTRNGRISTETLLTVCFNLKVMSSYLLLELYDVELYYLTCTCIRIMVVSLVYV